MGLLLVYWIGRFPHILQLILQFAKMKTLMDLFGDLVMIVTRKKGQNNGIFILK